VTLKACIEGITGQTVAFGGYRAGTDMTFLSAAGVPTVIFGPGSIDHAHTVDEHISLNEFDLSIAIYTHLVATILGGAA
jgi:acetylornithine deacetylase/succinyl-diaminopimelate desuccinylase-like protein